MKIVTIDFETYYAPDYTLKGNTLEEYIRNPKFEAIMVAIKHGDSSTVLFPKNHIAKGLETIDWDDTMLVAHNMMFDGYILRHQYGKTPKYYADTLSMARGMGLQAKVGGSLASLIKWAQSQGYPLVDKGTEVLDALGKKFADFNGRQLQAYANYCKTDVDNTYALFDIFTRVMGFPKSELRVVDEFMRLYCDPLLQLDKVMLAQHLHTVNTHTNTLLDRVGLTLEDMRSDSKLAEVLTRYGVEPPTKVSAKTGKVAFAFAKSDLAFQALQEHDDPDVQAIAACRLGTKSTIEASRTERFLGIAERGALSFPLQYYGAHTGRASGAEKINAQNLPRGGVLRDCIMAPAGHRLVVSDSAQIEARMVAWLAGQDDLVLGFRNKEDIYSVFASQVFGRQVTKADTEFRFVGKTAILGLSYGMGALKFQESLEKGLAGIKFIMDLAQAQLTVDLYRNKYAYIPALWRQAGDALKAMCRGDTAVIGVGMQLQCLPADDTEPARIMLPNGMCIRYPGLSQSYGERGPQFSYKTAKGKAQLDTYIYSSKVIENVAQALARIVITDQWLAIKKRTLKERVFHRSPVVGQVHDELICCVPNSQSEQMQVILTEEMNRAPVWAQGLPVACEVGVGQRYGDAK